MRLSGVPVASVLIAAGLMMTAPLPAQAQSAEARLRNLEATVRDLAARVAALEGGRTGAAPAPPASGGLPCEEVSVLAVWATPQAPLTVTVNGAQFGVYDGSISVTLDSFLRPGPNTIGFSYPAPPGSSAEAALKCQPPGASNSTTILSLRPAAGRLQAQATVNFVRGR